MKREYIRPALTMVSVRTEALMGLVTSGNAELGEDKTIDDPEAIQSKWSSGAWDEE